MECANRCMCFSSFGKSLCTFPANFFYLSRYIQQMIYTRGANRDTTLYMKGPLKNIHPLRNASDFVVGVGVSRVQ